MPKVCTSPGERPLSSLFPWSSPLVRRSWLIGGMVEVDGSGSNRSSGIVENRVPSYPIGVRAAQLNRFGGCSSQHKPAWAWLGLAVIGAQFLLVVPHAYADPQAIVTVSCDREKGELRVDESVE